MKSRTQTRNSLSPDKSPTSARALDIAERLIQTRGYNGFSYADIAVELGVTKAALHFHFATKEQLGVRIIERYRERFMEALNGIGNGTPSLAGQLKAYTALYGDTLRGHRMCLCGMLAAEYETLPAAMQDALRTFFDANEQWLAGLLGAGRKAAVFIFRGSPAQLARAFTATLEGAMLLARPYNSFDRFDAAASAAMRELMTSHRET